MCTLTCKLRRSALVALALVLAFSVSSCAKRDRVNGLSTEGHVRFYEPTEDMLPRGFVRVSFEGNGWYLYKSDRGYWMVSVQDGYYGDQVSLVYLGRKIDE